MNIPGPRILIIRLLEACDAGCFMCSFAHSNDSYRFTVEEAREVAGWAKQSTLRLVRFTGGEPLLHNGFSQIVSAFTEAQILTSVITNGGHITDRLSELVDAGISQFIVSLDSPYGDKHDRYRGTPGLFERAVRGLRDIRQRAPKVRTRVNTVAGPHNIADLEVMFNLLAEIGVDDWSIIPLKTSTGKIRSGAWPIRSHENARRMFESFRSNVIDRPGPRLIGYSLNWMGRSNEEIDTLLQIGQPMTPRDNCDLVNLVLYYTPRDGIVFPCNCVPHRNGEISFGTPWSRDLLQGSRTSFPAHWLQVNGPTHCMGCEPANAALGEGIVDVDVDTFAF